MNLKKHVLETATLVGAALVLAGVSNALSGRERKLALPGDYPNAMAVPAREEEAPPRSAPTAVPPTVSVAPDPTRPPVVVASPIRPTRTRPAPSPAAPAPVAKIAASAELPPAIATSTEEFSRRFPPHKDKPYLELRGEDVAWLHDRGALFLDARRTKVYEEGHIAGARSFSVWESDIDGKVTALVNEGRNTDAPVIVYCSGGDCEDSHMLAEKLFGVGFDNVLVYHDGWPDWQKRHGASRTGPQP